MWIQKVPHSVNAITYSLNGEKLYTLDSGGWLTEWDTATRNSRRLAQFGLWRTRVRPDGLQILASGQLAIPHDRYQIIDPATGGGSEAYLPDRPYGFPGDQVLPDGRVYFIARDRRTIDGRILLRREQPPAFVVPDVNNMPPAVSRFHIAPDKQSILVVLSDRITKLLFDLSAKGELTNPTPVVGVEHSSTGLFSPDSRAIVFLGGTGSSSRITLWDVSSRSVRTEAIEWAGDDAPVAFNPVLPLWAVQLTDKSIALRRLDTGELVRVLNFGLGKNGGCFCFSPDGLTCAVGGSKSQFAVFDVDA